jgi:dUTP pyrophosphatase
MKIKILDLGTPNKPKRQHDTDVGADVYLPKSVLINSGHTVKIPLGFGLEVPNGMAGFIWPRSGLASNGIVCQLPPIDPGYTGEIHAIVSNLSNEPFFGVEGDRIGQLVILPCIIPEFTEEIDSSRGDGAFGSTGR